jgi:hypothetical protein
MGTARVEIWLGPTLVPYFFSDKGRILLLKVNTPGLCITGMHTAV